MDIDIDGASSYLGGAHGEHGLDRERLALHHHARLPVLVVEDRRRRVEYPPDPVADKVLHDAVPALTQQEPAV